MSTLNYKVKNKCIAEIMIRVSSYKSKFQQMVTDLTNNTSYHFSDMQDHLQKKYPNFVLRTEKYATEIGSLFQDFGNRFCDLKN
jgi:hypothetical protein